MAYNYYKNLSVSSVVARLTDVVGQVRVLLQPSSRTIAHFTVY